MTSRALAVGMNWFEYVQFQAKLSPDEPAVIFPGGMATYGRLVECVDAAVQHVLHAGLPRARSSRWKCGIRSCISSSSSRCTAAASLR